MPDLPLSDYAIRRAKEITDGMPRYHSDDVCERRIVSSYLMHGGFDIEIDGDMQRLVGPWLPIQEEEKE